MEKVLMDADRFKHVLRNTMERALAEADHPNAIHSKGNCSLQMAIGAGLEDLGVSITHEGQASAAVAVGRCRSAHGSVTTATSGVHMSEGGAAQAPEEHEVGR
jgi:hypothetical protein